MTEEVPNECENAFVVAPPAAALPPTAVRCWCDTPLTPPLSLGAPCALRERTGLTHAAPPALDSGRGWCSVASGCIFERGHRGAEKSTSFTIRLPRCARSAGSATTSKFGRMEKRRQECLRHTSDCVALVTIRCFQHSGWEWMCYSSPTELFVGGSLFAGG
jgi:hypothetical protein